MKTDWTTMYVVTAAGFRSKDNPAAEGEKPKAEEISRAKQHLQQFWVPSKARTSNSYHLKHDVESTIGGYCSNGALIQAAIELGLQFKPDGSGINVLIFVKKNRDAWKAFNAKHPNGRLYA